MIAPPKNSPQATLKAKSGSRFYTYLVGIVALAVICGIGVWVINRPHESDNCQNAKTASKSAKKNTAAKANKPATASAQTNTVQKAVEKKKPEYVKRPGAMQLPDGRVLTFKPPKEGEFRIVHSHGSTYKCDHLGNWEDITPKPIFDNSFEETLVGMATTGNFIPGMLLGLDHNTAIKMLTKPVVINEDDSEDVVAKKEAVAQAKEAILDYMKGGATLDEFVREMRKQVVKEKFIRGMALKEIVASLKEGRVQDAADMRDAANKMLEKDSLPALKLPAHIENAIEGNK